MIKLEPRGEQIHLTFVLPCDEPGGKVSVVGDFNDWTPGTHTLVRRSNGTRSVKVAVPAGRAPGHLEVLELLAAGGPDARHALVRDALAPGVGAVVDGVVFLGGALLAIAALGLFGANPVVATGSAGTMVPGYQRSSAHPST